jgi:fumarate hydratase, class II
MDRLSTVTGKKVDLHKVSKSVIQVAAHAVGCDATITLCGQTGNFELNVTMPVVTLKLPKAIKFTANAISALTEKCVIGIEANEPRCRELVEKSLAVVTGLAPLIG